MLPAAKLPDQAIVPVSLLAFGFFAYFSLQDDSVTSDELAHLPAGFTYLDRRDSRLNPEHPPLAKIWAALPLWIASLRSPDYSSDGWRRPDQWAFGLEFLHGDPEGRRPVDPMSLLIPARLFMVLLGTILGTVLFALGREMFGRPAAYVALVLFVFSPTLLAHSRLVTTDVPAALGFVLSIWTFRRFCLRPELVQALTAGLALGVALLMKFSTVLLCPVLVFLAVVWILEPWYEGDDETEKAISLPWVKALDEVTKPAAAGEKADLKLGAAGIVDYLFTGAG